METTTPVTVINNPKPRRVPTYLSPSAISKYRMDQEAYYVYYCATDRGDNEPQTQAMAIGSAFDAYAKSYLHEKLFGKGNDPKYEFHTLFEAQVQSQWRTWAKLHGLYVFEDYQKNGALADLLTELNQSVNVPKFEIDITGVINNQREPKSMERGGVVFLGKPDVFYINKHGAHVILDWKVNGYLSKVMKSPMPGYVRLRGDHKKCGHHKDCLLTMHNGTLINGGGNSLHTFNIDWATQLSVYAWLCGCQVGEEFIAGIDQICCGPSGTEFPLLRFAEHRMLIAPEFQREVFTLSQDIWETVHSEHFFKTLSKEDSEARCRLLDTQALELAKMDQQFLEMTTSGRKW